MAAQHTVAISEIFIFIRRFETMKTVMKKLLSIMLVAILLVSAVPFQAFADDLKPATLFLVVDGVDTNQTTTISGNEGEAVTEAAVKAKAESEWTTYNGQTLAYERSDAKYASFTYGDNQTIYVMMKTVSDGSGSGNGGSGNGGSGNGGSENGGSGNGGTNTTGDLIVYAMTKTEATGYVDFNYGQPIIVEGGADATLNKALAEDVIGKQLVDYKWQGATEDADGNVTVNLLATILETTNGKAVYQLRVQHNDGTSNYTQIDIYEGEGILAAIKNAGITPRYADHVLVGYTLNHTGNATYSVNIYHVAEASMANEQGVIKVYADWREKTDDDDEDFEYGEGGGLNGDANTDPIYDVVLLVYTNGNVKNYAKKITASEMGAYTKDGKLTREEVQLIVQKNFKITSSSVFYGLFTNKTWDNGDYDVDYAKATIELDPDATNTVYVMVKNATAIKADPTNPQTGDGIVLTLAAMMSTGGAALVLGKKKFF